MPTFRNVTAKLGNMRKAVEWVVYPTGADCDSPERVIQSDKRIARVNLETGKLMLSDGKGGHPSFVKLMPYLGAKEYDAPQTLLDDLNALEADHGKLAGPVSVLGGSVHA